MNITFKKIKTLSAGLLISASFFGMSFAQAQTTRDVSKYNLYVQGENLNGYDPVAYFPEGGSLPQLGKQDLSLNYMGVTYMFASTQNLELFMNNPHKYEPTYGQWCARAMAEGSYVKINPLVYTIHENRLHFFVSNRAKDFFDADLSTKEARADAFWKQYSGEEPRY